MDFDVQTLAGKVFFLPKETSRLYINADECLTDPSMLQRIVFPEEKSLRQMEGILKIQFHSVSFEIRDRLIHAWTFFLLGIEQVMEGKSGSSPFLYGDFYQIKSINNNIQIEFFWNENDFADFPYKEFSCVWKIKNKYKFAFKITHEARKTLEFFELLYASDIYFHTDPDRAAIDSFQKQIESLESLRQ